MLSKFKSRKAIPKSWSVGHVSPTRLWAESHHRLKCTSVCVCDIAVQLIHRTIRGLSLQKMFWETHDWEKKGGNPPIGILLGKVRLSLAQHLKRDSEKPPIQPTWKGEKTTTVGHAAKITFSWNTSNSSKLVGFEKDFSTAIYAQLPL